VLDNLLDTQEGRCSSFLHVEVLPALSVHTKGWGRRLWHHQASWQVGRKTTDRANHAAVAEQWASCSKGKVARGIFVRTLRLKY